MFRQVLLAAAVTGLFSATGFAQTTQPQPPAPQAAGHSWQSIVGGADAVISGPPHQQEYQTRRVFHTQNPPDPDAYPYGVDQDWQIPVQSHS